MAEQQTLWEATKMHAQSAFRAVVQETERAFDNIGNSYQQIMLAGHLYPSMDRNVLNREIAEQDYKQPEPEQGELFYLNHFHNHGTDPKPPEPEQGLEPEM
jgi:hypothetical protein